MSDETPKNSAEEQSESVEPIEAPEPTNPPAEASEEKAAEEAPASEEGATQEEDAPKKKEEKKDIFAELLGEEDAVKAALLAMVEPTRKEAGCLCYNLHQSTKDKTEFMFYEQWANQEALKAHGKTPHMNAMRQAIKGRMEKGGATSYTLL